MIRFHLKKLALVLSLLLVFHQNGLTQTKADSAVDRKILVESFVISGTRSIDTAELDEITSSMTGLRFNNDEDELEERIRAKFQDRGYFTVQVQNLDIKVIDPLASPKAVRLEAEVADGPRCRLSGFNFIGNHNLSSAALRAKFSIKLGDPFRRDRIAGGLEGMRKLYASQGFLDSVFIPDTEVDSSATVKLNIEVQEGPQYRMGEFQVFAPPAIAAKLQTQWKLQPGTVFDRSYVETFLEKNHALLPDDFTLEDGVKMLKDCPDAIVSVHFHVTHDPQHEALDRGEPKDCEPAAGAVPADQ